MKTLYLILLISSLAIFIGCSKDKDSNNTTGIDFTSHDYMNNLDYLMTVGWMYDEVDLRLSSKTEVTDCEYKIDNILIDTSYWEEDYELDAFDWSCYISEDDLPDNVELTQGSEHDFSLLINGESFNDILTIPYKPIMNYPTFSVEEDFTFTWELLEDPITQVIYFYCGNDYKNTVFEAWQLEGAVRTYTISKDVYSEFVGTGITELDLYFDTANYKDFGDCVFITSYAGDEYEIDNNKKQISKNERLLQFLKQIRMRN